MREPEGCPPPKSTELEPPTALLHGHPPRLQTPPKFSNGSHRLVPFCTILNLAKRSLLISPGPRQARGGGGHARGSARTGKSLGPFHKGSFIPSFRTQWRAQARPLGHLPPEEAGLDTSTADGPGWDRRDRGVRLLAVAPTPSPAGRGLKAALVQEVKALPPLFTHVYLAAWTP